MQSSGDSARAARLDALAGPDGYPVRIRGLVESHAVETSQQVRSVRRTLTTKTDWDHLVDVFVTEAEYVLSNTGDRGFDAQPDDAMPDFKQAMSYPAKLQPLLRARFDAGAQPLTILPTELVVRNGDVLKARVLELSLDATTAYRDWLSHRVIWANSLVDRIVSEPIEPAGAVAEPYALWVIEKAEGLTPPCRHPSTQMVDNLDSIATLKLFVLNLGHTWLVSQWLELDTPPQTVSALLADPAVLAQLRDVYEHEVMPAFDAAGRGREARAYAETTIERYRNPFLEHQLADTAQNHAAKIERRLQGFLDWSVETGDHCEKPRLAAIVRKARRDV